MEITKSPILMNRGNKDLETPFPLAIRITYNRVPVPFPIKDIKISFNELERILSPKHPNIGARLRKIKETIQGEMNRIDRIIEQMGTFTIPALRERFYRDDPAWKKRQERKEKKRPNSAFGQDGERNGVLDGAAGPIVGREGKNKKYGRGQFDKIRSNIDFEKMGPLAVLFGEKIKKLERNEQIGTSESYFSTLKSLLRFKPLLRLEDVTEEFLNDYERWFLSKTYEKSTNKRSETTVGIHMRCLRHILNIEKGKGRLKPEDYPFGLTKYIIPGGENVKIALEISDVMKLWDYLITCQQESEHYHLSMWFFGLMANGINPKDIANLKYGDIHDNCFVILRQKTRRTARRKPRRIVIPILEPMQETMDKYGNPDKSPGNFIFSILKPGLSAHRQRELVCQFCNTMGDWMVKIGTKIGFTRRVGAKEYRHTYGTFLKHAGYSIHFIMEQYGHSELRTTESYLADHGAKAKREANTRIYGLLFKPQVSTAEDPVGGAAVSPFPQ